MTNGNPGAPTTVSTHTYRLQIVKERSSRRALPGVLRDVPGWALGRASKLPCRGCCEEENYSDSGLFAQDLHRLFAAHAHRERRAFCDCSIATEFNAKR
jgi:hypothetical protein